MKNVNILYLFLLLPISSACAAHNDFVEDLYDNESFDHLLDNIDPSAFNARQPEDCLPSQQIIDDLLMIGVPDALESDLYCVTYPPNERSVLRLPGNDIFETYQIFRNPCSNWAFGFTFFYNQMLKQYFTAHSPFLKSYLNIQNPDFLEQLDLDFLIETTGFNIPELFPLIQNFKLQERKCGMLLGTYKRWRKNAIQFILPLYWFEQNFFLTEEEIDAIQNAPIFAGAGAGTEQRDIEAYFLKHAVSTKFGIGDFKIRYERNVAETDCTQFLAGFQLILPTAAAIDGRKARLWWGNELLFGGVHCPCAPTPILDIAGLFRTVLCCPDPDLQPQCNQEAFDAVKCFLTAALERLTVNVADAPLGQEHVSLGSVATHIYNITARASWINKGSIEYFFPRKRMRFFLARVSPSAFVRNYTDEAQADANIAFLNQQLANTFFTYPQKVMVHPGVNVEFSTAFAYDTPSAHAEIGYDLWFQGKEHIGATQCQWHYFQINRGIRPWAYQSKIFGKIIGNCNCWHCGIEGDFTFDSRGIGKDMTIALNYVYDF